jgi:hypothetical protein
MSKSARLASALLLALLAAPAGSALAQAPALPPGRQVIERFIAAIGGRDAVLQQRTRHFTGRFESPAQGVAGDFELWQAAPNRMATIATLPGLGEVREGFDGTVAWTSNPATGPMVYDGKALDQRRHAADFYVALYPPETIASLETVGEEPFEGTAAWKVKVTTTWGEQYHEFFDKATGLQLGSVRLLFTPLGEVEATSVVSDWRMVGNVRMPFRLEQRVMSFQTVITFTDLKLEPLPDSLFTLPPEIRALVGK